MEVLKPIFEALSADDVLDCCLEGTNQNQNKSLNSVVCGLCPKDSLDGLNSMEKACAMTVAHYNDGAHTTGNIMRSVTLIQVGMFWEDSKCIYHARKKSQISALEARQQSRSERRQVEEQH